MMFVIHLLTAFLILAPSTAAFVLGVPVIPNIGSSAQYRSADRRSAPANAQFGTGAIRSQKHHIQGSPYGVPSQGFAYFPQPGAANPCPLSPYATFLNIQQQEALHELVSEARRNGADESVVREYMDRYVREILPSDKFTQFRQANVQFEAARRGKRSRPGSLKDDPFWNEQIHIRKPRTSARKTIFS